MNQWGGETEGKNVNPPEEGGSRLETMKDLREKVEAVLEQLTLLNRQGVFEVRDDLSRRRFLTLMGKKQYGRLKGKKAEKLREISVVDKGGTPEIVLLEGADTQTNRTRQFSINPMEKGEVIYLQGIHKGVVILITEWGSYSSERPRIEERMNRLIDSLLATDKQVR